MEIFNSKIEATVWCRKNNNFSRWKIANQNQSKELKLSGELTENEVGSIVQKICGQISFDKRFSTDNLFESVLKAKFEDFAFIKFIGEKGVETNNGCCSDFKDWKQLKEVKTKSIWFGHDPTPVFQYEKEKEEITVWIDDDHVGSNSDDYSVIYSWFEFENNLKLLEKNLNDFVILTKIWMEDKSPKFADAFVEKLRENLGV